MNQPKTDGFQGGGVREDQEIRQEKLKHLQVQLFLLIPGVKP